MRSIAAVTVARSDYGIYRPLLRAIAGDPALRLRIIAGGAHFRPELGSTVREIEADGFAAVERADVPGGTDTPLEAARAIGAAVDAFARAYAASRPDLLVVLGDRYEMFAAALAALPSRIPVAHIHGGELTEGAIDDALRHATTKLAHLHFASTDEYARRILQLGEEPWRVTVSGAPALDNLEAMRRLGAAQLAQRLGVAFDPAPLLVTFHPVTLEYERTGEYAAELVAALAEAGRPAILTAPGADPGGGLITEALRRHAASRRDAVFVENAGIELYFSLMAACAAMVGNSSSGIVEAASFALPVVNIGSRQQGRVRGANVIDVGHARGEILAGIRRALEPAFRAGLAGAPNPYWRGPASPRILERLKSVPLDERLIRKRFVDLPAGHG